MCAKMGQKHSQNPRVIACQYFLVYIERAVVVVEVLGVKAREIAVFELPYTMATAKSNHSCLLLLQRENNTFGYF